MSLCILTPHVHHWDSMMIFEYSTKSLFPSDLFIQPRDNKPVVSDDLSESMIKLYRGAGILASCSAKSSKQASLLD
jgi:flavorubredoxin